MSGDWKPGTVARATVRGVRDLLVMRTSGTRGGDDIWLSALHVGGWRSHTHDDVTDVRPLVVLDPDEIATPEENAGIPAAPEIAKCLRRLAEADGWKSWRARVAVRIADQIEAQTKPPKPSEPKGLGAVVEDSSHIRWVRVSNTPGAFPWLRDGHGVKGWSEIDAVRVLSEGVQS